MCMLYDNNQPLIHLFQSKNKSHECFRWNGMNMSQNKLFRKILQKYKMFFISLFLKQVHRKIILHSYRFGYTKSQPLFKAEAYLIFRSSKIIGLIFYVKIVFINYGVKCSNIFILFNPSETSHPILALHSWILTWKCIKRYEGSGMYFKYLR